MAIAEIGLGALLLLTAMAAAAFGAARERTATVVLLAVSAASLLLSPEPRAPVALAVLLVMDLAAVVLLGRLSWKAPGGWPIWTLGAEAVASAATIAFILQPDVAGETYLKALLAMRYVAASAVLVGTLRRRQAQP